MPLVSVLMSVYQEPPSVLNQAINSILNQSFQDYEFIIVLDNPNGIDQKKVLFEQSSCDARIKLIFNPQNLGLSKSLNRAASEAHGTYFCRMDADDESLPDRLETQIRHLTESELDLIGGYMNVIDEEGKLLYKVDSIPTADSSIARALVHNNCLPHPSWFGKTEVLRQAYREIPYSEDYDFLLRAQLSGRKLGNCPQIVLNYRMTNDSISRTNLFRQFLYQRYLSSCYAKGVVADPTKAADWVEEKWSPKKERRYNAANQLFNNGYSSLANKKLAGAAFDLARIPFTSLAYTTKLVRMILARLS